VRAEGGGVGRHAPDGVGPHEADVPHELVGAAGIGAGLELLLDGP